MTRWWFQTFYIFTPIWGRWTHFDVYIFQMGWFNHQPVLPKRKNINHDFTPKKETQIPWFFPKKLHLHLILERPPLHRLGFRWRWAGRTIFMDSSSGSWPRRGGRFLFRVGEIHSTQLQGGKHRNKSHEKNPFGSWKNFKRQVDLLWFMGGSYIFACWTGEQVWSGFFCFEILMPSPDKERERVLQYPLDMPGPPNLRFGMTRTPGRCIRFSSVQLGFSWRNLGLVCSGGWVVYM